jgi:POT family proton-dependent oligopeptide transporter
MTSIISNAYHNYPEKKDGAYSMYYMGGMVFRDYVVWVYYEKIWVGVWISRVLCCSNATVPFYSGHIWDIGLKPTAASKQKSKEKAAAENNSL